jgi:hypothetical protein
MTEVVVDPEFGTTVLDEGEVSVFNSTEFTNDEVLQALATQSPEYAALTRWVTTNQAAGRKGSLIDRDRYVTPSNIYEQMETAYLAVENDDVVSGVVDTTESLAFSRMSVDTEDRDETDVWNQIAENIDLEARLREMWREEFVVSQFVVATWWGTKSFKVRGTTAAGKARRRRFDNLTVPVGMTILDPLKIVPVGNLLFGQEKLAYAADKGEYDIFKAVIDGEREPDQIISQLMTSEYLPDETEQRMLGEEGLPSTRLFLLNPRNVWRHTATKSQYQRFASVRMKSVFELLDLKRQLRALDRSILIGSTNYLLLVKKGSDQQPALPQEVKALQSQVRTLARVPVIVGDHRLNVEIVTPKNDMTLQPERYNGIDSRITSRLFQLFSTGSYSSGTKADDSLKLARVVSRGLESRRHLIRKSVERRVLMPTYTFNDQFTQPPQLRFHPKRVALDFDNTFAQFLLDLRDRGDLSRESILEEVDFDQEIEYRRRKSERDEYDDVFQTMNPWGSKSGGQSADPRTAGRRLGGTRNGGGANNAPRRPNGEGDPDERDGDD